MRRSTRLLNNGQLIIKKEENINNTIKEEKMESDVAMVGKRKRTTVKVEIKSEKENLKTEIKKEEEINEDKTTVKKIKITKTNKNSGSPYPTYARPTKEECKEVCKLLSKVHGTPRRANFTKKDNNKEESESAAAACGEVPNVIQAVVRTILSQNTTQENGSRAYRSMERKFGKYNWQAVHESDVAELAEAIACGGLGKVKAGFIKGLLKDVFEKYGKFSLDHFHEKSDDEVFQELVQYRGVGPKTASCVLLFCLRRESFAVDTHIFRITKRLNWIPSAATRETAFLHLDERLPTDLKYPLHTLLIRHGKACKNCAANGKTRERTNVIQAKDCPIKKFMSKAPKKDEKGKGNGKGKKKVEESEEEEEEEEEEENESVSESEPEYVVESVSLEVEGIGK